MSPIRPFPGGVIDPAWAERVVSPMHDEVDPATRQAILASNPWSYLHVTHTPEDGDPFAAVEDNAAALRRLLDAGAFQLSPEPAMYVYQLRTRDHTQTGVVAEIPVSDVAQGRILGHEMVQPARVDALVWHFARIAPRSDLLALMHPSDDEVDGVVRSSCEGEPMLAIGPHDGLEQTVWRLADLADVAVIQRRLGGSTLYITDGHHRAAAATRIWEQRGRPRDQGVLCVIFPQEQLRVLSFHRRVAGPLEPATVVERIGERASVEPVVDQMAGATGIRLYVDRGWYHVLPHRSGAGSDTSGGSDVEWLHREILEPVFGIGDPHDPRLELVTGLTPIEQLTAACDVDGGALFALRPPEVTEIVRVAQRGGVMPPKATYFDPKPRSGVFLRLPS